MKLAEALMLRSDLQKKLTALRVRISNNVLFQEGSTPHEDPNALLQEAMTVIDQMETLIVRVNTANLDNKLPDGQTITAAIALRDSLAQRHSILQAAIDATGNEHGRYSAREIKWIAAVEVARLQKQSEDLSQKIRELNARIQETNWSVEI